MSAMSGDLKNIIEAVIMVSDTPVTVARVQGLFKRGSQPTADEVRAAITELQSDCEGRGVELRKVGKGYRYQSREQYADWIRSLQAVRPPRLSRALLETLAIIAYRQPVTRGDIEEIRGVTVTTEIMQRLQEREWIKEVGVRDVPGRPSLFGTTQSFLAYFNLESIKDLPELIDERNLGDIAKEMDTPLPPEVLAALQQAESDEAEQPVAVDAQDADAATETAVEGDQQAVPVADAGEDAGVDEAATGAESVAESDVVAGEIVDDETADGETAGEATDEEIAEEEDTADLDEIDAILASEAAKAAARAEEAAMLESEGEAAAETPAASEEEIEMATAETAEAIDEAPAVAGDEGFGTAAAESSDDTVMEDERSMAGESVAAQAPTADAEETPETIVGAQTDHQSVAEEPLAASTEAESTGTAEALVSEDVVSAGTAEALVSEDAESTGSAEAVVDEDVESTGSAEAVVGEDAESTGSAEAVVDEDDEDDSDEPVNFVAVA